MDDFSPMIMCKIPIPAHSRSRSSSRSMSEVAGSGAERITISSAAGYFVSLLGGSLSSASYAPTFDYISVLSENIANTLDQEFLDNILELIGYQPGEQDG